MVRISCSLLAVLLVFISGASAARVCACLETLDAPSCCVQKMPCCQGELCDAHKDSDVRTDLALDLFKAFEFSYAIPIMPALPHVVLAYTEVVLHVPQSVHIRGPDVLDHALRAPPVKAS
jgi:hypothetical protein